MQRLDYIAEPRRHGDLAAAVLSLAAARRRLRHRRLPRRSTRPTATMRDFRASSREAHERGIRVITELVINHTSDQHPWFQRARQRQARLGGARLLRLERHRPELQRHPHHLHRHREIELDLGPGRQGLFLAPLLLAPARSELRQSARAARRCMRRHALLARHGRRRAAARRHPLSDRARGHEQREPARDARRPEEDPRRARRALSRPHAARRGQPVAGGHARPISATATNATWRSTSR